MIIENDYPKILKKVNKFLLVRKIILIIFAISFIPPEAANELDAVTTDKIIKPNDSAGLCIGLLKIKEYINKPKIDIKPRLPFFLSPKITTIVNIINSTTGIPLNNFIKKFRN